MTISYLNTLLSQVDLDSATDRGMASDACEDAGWLLPAKLLRSPLPVRITEAGRVRPLLHVTDAGSNDRDVPVQWVNCAWGPGTPGIGGCWVLSAGDARRENDRNGWSRTPYEVSAGEVTAYEGSDMTGGAFPDAEYYAGVYGLDLDDEEAEKLTEWLQDESARVCQREADEILAKARLAPVREAYREASGSWEGCNWTQPFCYSYEILDDDGDCVSRVEGGFDAEYVDPDVAPEDCARHALDGDVSDDDLYERVLAAATEAVEYARDCRDAATAAERAAGEALASAEAGEWGGAVRHAQTAVRLESQYGDAPTWRRLLEAIEAAAEDA